MNTCTCAQRCSSSPRSGITWRGRCPASRFKLAPSARASGDWIARPNQTVGRRGASTGRTRWRAVLAGCWASAAQSTWRPQSCFPAGEIPGGGSSPGGCRRRGASRPWDWSVSWPRWSSLETRIPTRAWISRDTGALASGPRRAACGTRTERKASPRERDEEKACLMMLDWNTSAGADGNAGISCSFVRNSWTSKRLCALGSPWWRESDTSGEVDY